MTTELAGQVPMLVEVNELAIMGTSRGVDWWMMYRLAADRMPVSRIVERGFRTPQGAMCTVVLDGQHYADQFLELALGRGVPKTAIRIRRDRASMDEAARRQREVDGALDAAVAGHV